jgi:5,10-methylenetetrahydrofolate reductase
LESFDRALRKHQQYGVDKFLIVGGNIKEGGLSTLDAISRAKSLLASSSEVTTSASSTTDVWCVANPNNKNSIFGVKDKLLAGADGVVAQPLLTSYAAEVLDSYPTTSSSLSTTLAGVALPKTERGLLFWLQLLDHPNDIETDELFQASLQHFQSNKSPLDWAQSQIAMYPPELDGLHYMPMSNTDLLLDLLARNEKMHV